MSNNDSAAASLLLKNARTSLESCDAYGVGTSLKRARIDKALQLFTRALAESHPSDHLSKQLARKGQVECHAKHLSFLMDEKLTLSAQPALRYNLGLALEACNSLGSQLDLVEPILVPSLISLIDVIPTHSTSFAVASSLLHHVVNSLACFKPPTLLATGPRLVAMHALLEATHHEAVRAVEAGQWARALNHCSSLEGILDDYAALEASAQRCDNQSSSIELTSAATLRTDWNLLIGICRASQLLQMGDKHWDEAQRGLPEDLYARTLLAQDDYRAALTYATEQDIELEGTALTRIARFYEKVAKLPVVAHQLYLRSVQLASSLAPALPKGAWYPEATAAVQSYRDALAEKEAQEWQEKRKPFLEKLAGDMDKLQAAKDKSNRQFCEFVLQSWPPKTPGFTELPSSDDPKDSGQLSRKLMVKVIARYHTDKNTQYGNEWLVLCEEISKALTARYNVMKGVD